MTFAEPMVVERGVLCVCVCVCVATESIVNTQSTARHDLGRRNSSEAPRGTVLYCQVLCETDGQSARLTAKVWRPRPTAMHTGRGACRAMLIQQHPVQPCI